MSEHITKLGDNGINLIKYYESFKSDAYLCPTALSLLETNPSKVFYTIGYGATYYKDGSKIKKGDKLTEAEALDLLKFHINQFSKGVDDLTTDAITQNQFDALVSFAFNCGLGNYKTSNLLKLVNKNPIDFDNISKELLRWDKSNGKPSNGLKKRRTTEGVLYSTGVLKFSK